MTANEKKMLHEAIKEACGGRRTPVTLRLALRPSLLDGQREAAPEVSQYDEEVSQYDELAHISPSMR